MKRKVHVSNEHIIRPAPLSSSVPPRMISAQTKKPSLRSRSCSVRAVKLSQRKQAYARPSSRPQQGPMCKTQSVTAEGCGVSLSVPTCI